MHLKTQTRNTKARLNCSLFCFDKTMLFWFVRRISWRQIKFNKSVWRLSLVPKLCIVRKIQDGQGLWNSKARVGNNLATLPKSKRWFCLPIVPDSFPHNQNSFRIQWSKQRQSNILFHPFSKPNMQAVASCYRDQTVTTSKAQRDTV